MRVHDMWSKVFPLLPRALGMGSRHVGKSFRPLAAATITPSRPPRLCVCVCVCVSGGLLMLLPVGSIEWGEWLG